MFKVLAISVAALIAIPASAVTVVVPLGTISVPPTISFSQGVNFTTSGANSAQFTFNIANAMTLTASSFTNTEVAKKGAFNFTSIGLYSGTGVSGTLLEAGSILPRTFGTTLASLGAYTLETGAYTIAYSGTVKGAPASVGTSITFASAAVPEPASWALMVAGFGLVGVSIRRRSQSNVAA